MSLKHYALIPTGCLRLCNLNRPLEKGYHKREYPKTLHNQCTISSAQLRLLWVTRDQKLHHGEGVGLRVDSLAPLVVQSLCSVPAAKDVGSQLHALATMLTAATSPHHNGLLGLSRAISPNNSFFFMQPWSWCFTTAAEKQLEHE